MNIGFYAVDRFDFWVLLSGILFLFLIISLISKFFSWVSLKKELRTMKSTNNNHIFDKKKYLKKSDVSGYDVELLELKKKIEDVMKDAYVDAYAFHNMEKSPVDESDFFCSLEDNLDRYLDSRILSILREKDLLLGQKQQIISDLQEKNRKIVKDLVHKMFYLLLEKDKLLKHKESLIHELNNKIEDVKVADLVSLFPSSDHSVSSKITHKE
ncbi:TPA: hypothetical protein DEP21_03985 [Patescibacteria group bacterium]|nr:hypothetical protein [Candidatus Gracilibacteria bacterium]